LINKLECLLTSDSNIQIALIFQTGMEPTNVKHLSVAGPSNHCKRLGLYDINNHSSLFSKVCFTNTMSFITMAP